MTTTESTPSKFEKSTKALVTHYDELHTFINKYYFSTQRFQIVRWPDLEKALKWKVFLYHILFPYSTFYHFSNRSSLNLVLNSLPFFIIWSFYGQLGINMGIALLASLMQDSNTSSTVSTETSVIVIILGVILIFLFIAYGLATYAQTLWHIFNKYNTWKTKAAWTVGLLLLMGILVYLINEYDSGQITAILSNPLQKPTLLLAVFAFFVPGILVLYSMLAIAISLLIEVFVNAMLAILKSLRPLPLKLIEHMVNATIDNDGKPWKLSDIDSAEIISIQKWAEKNMEANEKKTVPSIVLYTFFGILVSSGSLHNWINELITKSTEIVIKTILPATNPPTTLEYMWGFLLLMLLGMIIGSFVAQFQNYLVQGTIIQICVVAEYAKQKNDDQTNKTRNASHWLSRLINLLFNLRG